MAYDVPIGARLVPGVVGIAVNEHGDVFTSLQRFMTRQPVSVRRNGPWVRRHPCTNAYGYKTVAVCVDDSPKQITMTVHRLVLTAFRGYRPKGMAARHLNGDRLDNRLSNLAWGSYKENSADIARHGRIVDGERHYASKLNDVAVRVIRLLASRKVTYRRLAEAHGVSVVCIWHVVHRSSWKSV